MQSIHNSDPLVTSTPLKTEEPAYAHEKKDVTPSTPVKLVNINVIILLLRYYYGTTINDY